MQEKLKLIEFFEFMRDKEASKPLDEMDTEAIDAYVKVLLYLQDKHIDISSDFIDEQVRKIFRSEDDNTAPETVTSKKRYNKRIIWIVAACIALLVALFSMVSVASDDWSFIEFIKEKFGSVQSAPAGEEIEFKGETIMCNGKATRYSSVEDFLKAEKLDILYPYVLPDGCEIATLFFYDNEESKEVSYMFNDQNLVLDVCCNETITDAEKEAATEVVKINSFTCYIYDMPDVSTTQIFLEHNGNKYVLSYSEKEVLIKIIENLKVINND